MGAENFQGALEAYQAAHELMGVPTTGIEVGRAQRKLGLLLEARDSWIQVTRIPKEPSESLPFIKAREEAARLAIEVGERIPTISVRVEGAKVSETSIYLDDVLLSSATAGLPLRVNPGPHRLRAVADGYAPTSAQVTVSEGESQEITLVLSPAAQNMSADKQKDRGSAEGNKDGDLSLRRAMGFGALGVGAVGLSLGSVLGIVSMGHASRAKENCDGNRCSQAADPDISSAKATGTLSTIGFIAGGVGLSVGLYLLLVPDEKPTQAKGGERLLAFEAWQVRPRRGGAELSVEGVFF